MAQSYKLIWICHGTVSMRNPNIIKQPYNFNFNCLHFYCPNGGNITFKSGKYVFSTSSNMRR